SVCRWTTRAMQTSTIVVFCGFTSIWEAEDICLGWCELIVGSEYDGVLGWRAELAELQERLGELFGRTDARRQANLYLEGLLSAVERKNGWQLAEQIGDARPWRTQRVLSRTLWAADAARDLCREYVVEHLGAADGVLVIDETGFLKRAANRPGWRGNTTAPPGASTLRLCSGLPDWGVSHLCQRSRARADRSRTVYD